MTVMDIDEIFVKFGNNKLTRRQIVCTLIVLCGQICAASHMVFMVFAGRPPKIYVCRRLVSVDKYQPYPIFRNESVACNALLVQKRCDYFEYNDDYASIAMEWSLICNESYKVQLAQSIFMAGNMLGCFFWGFIADKYGRLRTVYISSFLICACSFFTGFATSFNQFVLFRFGTGFGVAGHGVSTFVLSTELVGSKFRPMLGTLINGVFALGIGVLVFLDLAGDSWTSLSNHVTMLNFVIFLSYGYLVESPRWLLSKGRQSECKNVMKRLLESECDLSTTNIQIKDSSAKTAVLETDSYFYSVLKYRTFRRWTFVQLFVWFTTSVVYYGLTLAGETLYSNLHISVLLSGLIELPGYVLVTKLIDRYKRKHLLVSFLAVTSLSCFLIKWSSQISDDAVFKLYCALVGKLFVSAVFAVLYIYSMELFPTNLSTLNIFDVKTEWSPSAISILVHPTKACRLVPYLFDLQFSVKNFGFGLCNGSGRLGSVTSPLIPLFDTVYSAQQFSIFGLLCFLAALLSCILPETKDFPLPERMDDVLSRDSQTKMEIRKKSINFEFTDKI